MSDVGVIGRADGAYAASATAASVLVVGRSVVWSWTLSGEILYRVARIAILFMALHRCRDISSAFGTSWQSAGSEAGVVQTHSCLVCFKGVETNSNIIFAEVHKLESV